MVLHLEGGTRAHFMRVLAAEYPQLVAGYERLFTAKYAPPAYTGEVGHMVGLLKAKYGVATRARTPVDPPTRRSRRRNPLKRRSAGTARRPGVPEQPAPDGSWSGARARRQHAVG